MAGAHVAPQQIISRAMPGSRILMVEDDPDVRMLMEHVLTGEGYTVDPVGTVEAARTALASNKYDLALVDGVLPDGSGIAVAEEAEERGIPAIVATAYAFRFPKRDLARYGLLLKPVRPDELLEAVKSALRPSTSS
jgi:DNA-binding response OmpR family regulator